MNIQLSSSQRAVVDAGDEALLVIAGPGAGKTTVLCARIAHLLALSSGSYRKILGITYTNVAARNLRSKLEELGGDALDRVLVSTFHGFANRVLQQHGSHIGLRTDFSIVNETEDRLELLKRAAASVGLPADEIRGRGEPILQLLSRLYERCMTAEEAKQLFSPSHDNWRVADKLFEAYISQSVSEGQLEFSLLVNLCARLLKRFKQIARQTRQVYEHICVDEFQDTNEMQYRLLEIIAEDDSSGLMLLADQDQVIYQWNGASPSRLKDARERFGMTVLLLPTSYRCPDNIVAAASRLIAHNTQRLVTPEYDSQKQSVAEVRVMAFGNDRDEATWVAEQLAILGPEQWEQTVVLARNRKILTGVLKAATDAGIACAAPVAKYDFVSAPLVMLHSILRLANQPSRQTVLRRLVTSFYVMTGHELDAAVLFAKAEERSVDVLTAFFDELLPHAKSEQFRKLDEIVRNGLITRKDFRSVSNVFFAWVDALPKTALKVAYEADYEEERQTWAQLEMRHQGMKSDNVPLSELLRQIDLEAKSKGPEGCVRFLTVHGAKGLEFSHVFLMGAVDGQFPAFQAINAGANSQALEEERRSFFVAVTRAMESLALTYAERYFGRPAVASRFIGEMELTS